MSPPACPHDGSAALQRNPRTASDTALAGAAARPGTRGAFYRGLGGRSNAHRAGSVKETVRPCRETVSLKGWIPMANELERFMDCMEYRPSDRRPNHELGVWPQTIERWRAEAADAIEERVPAGLWPVPTYGEMLFLL